MQEYVLGITWNSTNMHEKILRPYFPLIVGWMFVLHIKPVELVNLAPFFMPGNGDMARFSLPENTPIGSSVYQLKGSY